MDNQVIITLDEMERLVNTDEQESMKLLWWDYAISDLTFRIVSDTVALERALWSAQDGMKRLSPKPGRMKYGAPL